MQKILLVGCGGIGSYLAEELYILTLKQQLPNTYITLADFDTVDLKNLSYQNFKIEDLLENKAQVLAKRFNFNAIKEKITKKHLLNYNLIISAVDNTVFRKELFELNNNIDWIDLRSYGTTCVFYCKHSINTTDYLLSTLPKNDILNSSCQLEQDINTNTLQLGNKIIATIGAQLILNWVRGIPNNPFFTFTF